MASQRFIPKNPDKYAGDPRRIVARSSWEIIYMQALDNSNIVVAWISEPKTLNISYVNPLDKKVHKYWPDFFVVYIDGSRELIEVKPLKEANGANARSAYDKLMLVKNMSKWAAADKFASRIGARFRVVTESNIFPKSSKTRKRARK